MLLNINIPEIFALCEIYNLCVMHTTKPFNCKIIRTIKTAIFSISIYCIKLFVTKIQQITLIKNLVTIFATNLSHLFNLLTFHLFEETVIHVCQNKGNRRTPAVMIQYVLQNFRPKIEYCQVINNFL